MRAFHSYASWLVSISWKRFAVLSLLLLIGAGVLSNLPPFRWTTSERIETRPSKVAIAPSPPKPPTPPTADGSAKREPLIKIERAQPGRDGENGEVKIMIGGRDIRITPHASAPAASVADAAASSALEDIKIVVPSGASSQAVQEAIEEAKRAIRETIAEARSEAEQARQDAAEASRKAKTFETRVRRTDFGEALPEMAFFWIVASMIVKITYKGQLRAQAQAAEATEVAESEQLKRQVVEARMAAMQAQVEPHFLFNTLASIDHLIETDPPRASQMQKNLIALLRAAMPTMREANHGGLRDLGREMAMIKPYLEILKVRMEDRLACTIDVPEGLYSAEFPPMMIQSLVENAIKHGLEPKPEGGTLKVKAEIVHGKLALTVADTGLGFGKAATAGTGVGLANIRERLQLLYGAKASLSVAENRPSGTVVTVTLPYTARADAGSTA